MVILVFDIPFSNLSKMLYSEENCEGIFSNIFYKHMSTVFDLSKINKIEGPFLLPRLEPSALAFTPDFFETKPGPVPPWSLWLFLGKKGRCASNLRPLSQSFRFRRLRHQTGVVTPPWSLWLILRP